jgi:hypothetical protein
MRLKESLAPASENKLNMSNVPNNQQSIKSVFPWHGWLLGGFLLLFGLLGVYDSVMSFAYKEQYFKDSGMTPEQMAYFSSMPVWVSIGAAVCSCACLLGSVALLARLRVASHLYLISAVSNLLYIFYAYFLSAGREAMGVLWLVPIIMTCIIAASVFYSRRLRQ